MRKLIWLVLMIGAVGLMGCDGDDNPPPPAGGGGTLALSQQDQPDVILPEWLANVVLGTFSDRFKGGLERGVASDDTR